MAVAPSLKRDATSAIPSLSGLPIVGNAFEFRKDLPHLLLRAFREHGDVVRLHNGRHEAIFVNSPEDVHKILVERTDVVEKRTVGDSARAFVMGDGLLNSDGEFHQRQRKLCAPAFQPRNIAAYAGAMTHYSRQVEEEWGDGEAVDLSEQMHRITMGIAGKALFGADLLDEADEIRRALFVIRHYISRRSRNTMRQRLSRNQPRSDDQDFKRAKERLDATIYRLINEREEAGAAQRDLLSMLLRSRDEDGSGMSAKLLRDEAINLFWAGHETSASSLTWTWFLLARNPQVYDRMQAELRDVLGSRLPEVTDIPALAFTQRVFKEALRIYPPIFAFGRQVYQPFELRGYTLPAGTSLLISPYTLHRRTDVFPDPERFDPDRFEGEAEHVFRLSYLPFGSGQRVCLGAHFATMEGTIVLATLGQRVRFELEPGQNIVPERVLTQQNEEKVMARVLRR